tara:strand:- start:17 stop:664 length:648 start_codon:yes stop_codon:yes gene_type:complete
MTQQTRLIQTSFFSELKKDKPVKIIQIDTSGLKPIKMEEINYGRCADLLPDTYMLYPTGGCHPFYGIPNTLPRYQLPIWPYVKRIKWEKEGKWMKKKQMKSIINSKSGYADICCTTTHYYTENKWTQKSKNGLHYINNKSKKKITLQLHKLVARAWIPNPDNKPNVLHINDDPTNYLIENLMWGTQSDNMRGVKKHHDVGKQRYLNLVHKGIIKG